MIGLGGGGGGKMTAGGGGGGMKPTGGANPCSYKYTRHGNSKHY